MTAAYLAISEIKLYPLLQGLVLRLGLEVGMAGSSLGTLVSALGGYCPLYLLFLRSLGFSLLLFGQALITSISVIVNDSLDSAFCSNDYVAGLP